MDKLKKGDIVLNGYAAKGVNDLHIIVGSVSSKTGMFSVTQYYECRMLFKGKLQSTKSLFNKRDNKLTKIGHFDFDDPIKQAMLNALADAGVLKTEGK